MMAINGHYGHYYNYGHNGHFFVTSRRRRATMGDFQANFLRPDTGINTVEGNVAGSRAAGLSKKRAAEQADFEVLSFIFFFIYHF